MNQDILATFDDKRDVSSAALGTGIFSVANSPNKSTNSYDTSAKGVPLAALNYAAAGGIGGPLLHDIGRGRKVKLVVQVTTTMVGATATLSVDFISSATQDLGTPTVLLSSAAIAIGTLVAGYRFRFGSIPGVVPQQFVGVQYNVGTATITAGNISAFLALDVDDHADILG